MKSRIDVFRHRAITARPCGGIIESCVGEPCLSCIILIINSLSSIFIYIVPTLCGSFVLGGFRFLRAILVVIGWERKRYVLLHAVDALRYRTTKNQFAHYPSFLFFLLPVRLFCLSCPAVGLLSRFPLLPSALLFFLSFPTITTTSLFCFIGYCLFLCSLLSWNCLYCFLCCLLCIIVVVIIPIVIECYYHLL